MIKGSGIIWGSETVKWTHHNNAGQETLVTNCEWNGNYKLLYMHDEDFEVIWKVNLEAILWMICAQLYYLESYLKAILILLNRMEQQIQTMLTQDWLTNWILFWPTLQKVLLQFKMFSLVIYPLMHTCQTVDTNFGVGVYR